MINDFVRESTGLNLILPDILNKCLDIRLEQDYLDKAVHGLKVAVEHFVSELSGAVESRDPYTAGHQRRVAWLGANIARQMKLSDESISTIKQAGLVHDIGKLSIPLEILNKVGALTQTEFDSIKKHPQTGFDFLHRIGFPHNVEQIVWQHHERLNGSGYPKGLIGEQILLETRILSLADVIDAMAVARPYRPSLGVIAALTEIVKNQSVLYDKDVVGACLAYFERKGFRLKSPVTIFC